MHLYLNVMENIGNIMKTQMFAIGAMKEDSNMIGLIWGFIMMTVMENFMKILPQLVEFLKSLAAKYYEKKKISYMPDILNDKKIKSSITFERKYKEEEQNVNEIVDSILEYICKQNNAKNLIYSDRFMVNNKEEFDITNKIKCKVREMTYNNENDLILLTFKIYSYELELSELRAWVQNIYHLYQIQKKNNLGDKKYFFNEIPLQLPFDNTGEYRFETAPPNLSFSMSEFNTNKTLSNVFGKYVEKIKERIDLFINHPEWYKKRGIPHTLGIMLHGPPGTGKTSIIKAIAKDTDRHIINISLRETSTQSQLRNLFFNENLVIVQNKMQQNILIPLEQRIYVIEDIDCLTDVVLDRKYKEEMDKKDEEEKNMEEEKKIMTNMMLKSSKNVVAQANPLDSFFNNSLTSTDNISKENITKKVLKNTNSEKITLSFLLNLLDGVLETPGRILIITSNYPEKLDKALIRPGRIDLSFRFGNADNYMIKKMLKHFYEKLEIKDDREINKLDNKFTPAELINTLCMNYTNGENALKELKQKLENIDNDFIKTIDNK